MNVLHVGPMNLSAGGPALSMYNTVKGLMNIGVNASILSDYTNSTDNLIGYDAKILFWRGRPVPPVNYIPNIRQITDLLENQDIIHFQGIWQYCYHQLIKRARLMNIPYIHTPRGALYPQALKKKKLKKYIGRLLYQDVDLKNAACIMVTCNEEMKHIRNLGFKNPIAVIPNPIDVVPFTDVSIPIKEKKIIGYLGRLHPRKHIERLIYAFAHIPALQSAELMIMGKGDDEYETYLKNEVTRLKLDNVFFKGFVKGDEKDKAIRRLSLLALPSDFENFGNVISEALVRGVPVVTTHGAPWEIVKENKCGWWIDNSIESIESALTEFIYLTPIEIQSMGIRGHKLVSERFSIKNIAKRNKEMYEWILGRISKPDFIKIN